MADLVAWNDSMFEKHPTPYYGLAGWVERARVSVIKQLANITHEDTVLEIGCEAGNLLQALPASARTVGFDISPKALTVARSAFLRAGRSAEFIQGDAAKPLPFEPGAFSVIICSEMLEHVHDPQLVIQRIHQLASKDTRVILTVPYERPKLIIKKLLTSLGVFRVILPGIEEGLSEWHLQEFSKERLLSEIKGLFEPIYIKTLLGLHVVAEVKKIS